MHGYIVVSHGWGNLPNEEGCIVGMTSLKYERKQGFKPHMFACAPQCTVRLMIYHDQ
jgi:hypothetical protein